jgi:DNA-binding MarR family transcriptional regulator
LSNSTASPYNLGVKTEEQVHFRQAYWRVIRDLDMVRLRVWEQSGLTLPQLRVLYAIRREPGITTRDLARAVGITVSTASGLVSKLVEHGLVERTTLPDDRRQLPLRLTEAGGRLTTELSEPGRRFLDAVADELGEDLSTLTAALERLSAAAARVRAVAPLAVPARQEAAR